MRIAGLDTPTLDPVADALKRASTGAIILYPTVEKGNLSGSEGEAVEDEKITIGFHLVTPTTTVPAGGKLMHWVTVDKTNPYALVVDTP